MDTPHRAQPINQIHDNKKWLYQNDPYWRFWAKVDQRSKDECWLWTAALDDKGYGMFKLDGWMQKAHRVSWMIANGDANGLGVLHRCDTPACVNPRHLFLGNHSDNMKDCAAKGRLNTQNGKGGICMPGVYGSLPRKTERPRRDGTNGGTVSRRGVRKDGKPRSKPAPIRYWK
jgi:hypothetical protein